MTPLLLLAAVIYAGKLGNPHTSAGPTGDTLEKIMADAIEEARALMEMVERG